MPREGLHHVMQYFCDPVYNDTSAHYDTVEQQGRLTLHLHMLIWIKGCLSSQEIRDKIMNPTSDFQQRIVEYLESVHVGEFLTGSQNEVKARVAKEMYENKDYKNPTQTLPNPPPDLCSNHECDRNCFNCKKIENWWNEFHYTVDDLILRSNVHDCERNKKAN